MRRVLALLVGLVLVAGCGQAGAPKQPKSWVKVGSGPVGVAADDGGSLWVVGSQDNSLTRVDPGDVITTTLTLKNIGAIPLRVATGFGAVWVTSFEDGKLLKIDPTSSKVIATTSVGKGAEGVATGLGSIWVIAQDSGLLLKVRPTDAKIVQRIDVGVGARLVATDDHVVWVSQFTDGRMLRIDPNSGRVVRSGSVCRGLQGLAPTPDRLWVTCTLEDKVLALDPSTLKIVGTYAVTGQPDPIRIAPDGSVLVGVEDGPTLVVLDPKDGHLIRSKRVAEVPPLYDRANIDLAVADGQAWLSSFGDGRLYRVALN